MPGAVGAAEEAVGLVVPNDTLGDGYSGYQIVPLTNNFLTSGQLNLNSKVVQAVDWGETGCTAFPGNDGNQARQT